MFNFAKTAVLMAAITALFIVVGGMLGGEQGMLMALLMAVGMNFFSYWYSDKIVLSMYRAQPITREQSVDLWNVVENLSITAGLPMPKVYIIPDDSPNAFATGRNKEHAAVAVTSGLLQILNKTELEGVIAHELSHIGNRDILISTIVIVLVGFVSILSQMFLRGMAFGGRRGGDREGGNAIFVVIGIVLAILSPIAVTLIQLAVSRKREYLADASGALLTRYPEGLAGALEKISQNGRPMNKASQATAHLFIVNPFGSTSKKLGNLFSTHPPVEERIRILLNSKNVA